MYLRCFSFSLKFASSITTEHSTICQIYISVLFRMEEKGLLTVRLHRTDQSWHIPVVIVVIVIPICVFFGGAARHWRTGCRRCLKVQPHRCCRQWGGVRADRRGIQLHTSRRLQPQCLPGSMPMPPRFRRWRCFHNRIARIKFLVTLLLYTISFIPGELGTAARRTHLWGIKFDIVRCVHQTLVVIVSGYLPLIVQMTNIIKAPERDSRAWCLHRRGGTSAREAFECTALRYANSLRAAAKTHIHDENTVDVEYLDTPRGARGCRAHL